MNKLGKMLLSVGFAGAMLFSSACGVVGGRRAVVDKNAYIAGGGSGEQGIDYNGTININLPLTTNDYDNQALKAVAGRYMELHPETTVNVTPWASESYAESVNSLLMGGTTPKTDIVQTYTLDSNYLPTKFVDYSTYLTSANPYEDGEKWMNVLDKDAYQLFTDKSGIYDISLTTNMSFFVYNKEIWQNAGLTENDKPQTWDEFVSVCQRIKNNTGKAPLALSGETATSGPISWLLNVYTDQYYRSAVDGAHAVEGDYCYDADIDGKWIYDVADKNNDSSSNYTLNDLRFFNMVETDAISAADSKFQGMLANFKKLIPAYCQANFKSANQLQAENEFWTGNAAIIYHTGEFFNIFKEKSSLGGFAMKDYGLFFAPPMSGTGDQKPDSDYTRSVGGAVGWYGVIKKNKKQNDLVMDFMMFWGSKQGQQVYYNKIKEQDAYANGSSLVKAYEMSSDIYPGKDYAFPGLCHNNPMGNFWGGLVNTSGDLTTMQKFNSYTKDFLNGDKTAGAYATDLMNALKEGILNYCEKLNWDREAWKTPDRNPKK